MIPPLASRFVAGEDISDALAYAMSQNEQNVGAIVNLLGEHYSDPAAAEADTQVYLDIIEELSAIDSKICISVKPSQVGFDIGANLFRENIGKIADAAAHEDVFVWIDMEDHTTTDATLDAYQRLSAKHSGGVGVCLQANLKRTEEDLQLLADTEGKVRLVKGAYDEPRELAYKEKAKVDEKYREYMRYMFREFDDGIAIGSHDPDMVTLARELYDEYGTEFEIQMLMGVREEAQYDLTKEWEVWQYIPFGDRWISYFYRRLMERKENLVFGLRALFGV